MKQSIAALSGNEKDSNKVYIQIPLIAEADLQQPAGRLMATSELQPAPTDPSLSIIVLQNHYVKPQKTYLAVVRLFPQNKLN